jgi:hypothetical protein
LEKIPALYREPLILFYRERQSIERVAAALELSEDTVKQRLSRGRKLLHAEVEAFVQETLRRTVPGEAFSGAVVAMLPLAAGPAVGAAGASVTANGTAAAAKSGFLASLLVPLAPFIGIAAGLGAHWLIVRESTTEGRVRSKRVGLVVAGWILFLALAVGGEAAVHALGRQFAWDARIRFVAVAVFWWCFVAATITFQMVAARRAELMRRQRARSQSAGPEITRAMKPVTRALVIAGVHVALFAWLIALAARYGDFVGAAISVGAMLGLAGWALFKVRRDPGGTLLHMLSTRLALAAATILLILNLRARAWVASAYGVTSADAGAIVPMWIIPVLSVALVLWVGLVLALARRDDPRE